MRIVAAGLIGVSLVIAGCSGGKSDSSKPNVAGVTEPTSDPTRSSRPDVSPTKPTTPNPTPDPKLPPKLSAEVDPRVFKVEETGKGPWKAVKIDGKKLAQNVSKAMNSLAGTNARTLTTMKLPTGNAQVQSDLKVKNSKTFSVQYPLIGPIPEQCEVIADGKTKAYRGPRGTIDTRKPVGAPGPDASISASELAKVWPKDFPRLVFRGLIEGKDPWGPLLTELTSPKSDFETQISERVMPYKGMQIKSLRLTAKRKPAAAKKLGACEFEMVFDSKHYLPVTIRVDSKDPNGAEYGVYWITHWLFKKTFPAEDFKTG